MQVVEDALISFFVQVAKKDPARLNMLQQEPCFSVEQGRWCFTLPDLHLFLQHQDDVFSPVDYKQFRKLLFNSPVNRAVKEFGAEVTIIGNRAKVDKSRYALVWQTTSLARDHE